MQEVIRCSYFLGDHLYQPSCFNSSNVCVIMVEQVLQQETEAIVRLANVLKKDTRDVEIIMSEGTEDMEDGVERKTLKRLT